MSGSAMQHFNNGRIDIHAGGIDLKFPHHENEIAQSEAYLGCQQWINYWLHTGHVEIRGLKMSKSLKNFVTIQEALSTFTARQMRFCFLLHKYNEPMEYSDNTMNNAVDIEKIFSEFFHKVKAVLRRIGTQRRQHLDESELKLSADLEQTKADVHTALMDDFDTPRAVNRLKDLVNKSNRYIDGNNISSILLSRIGRYLTEIFDVFGLVNDANEIGFPFEATADLDKTGERVSSEKLLTPFLDVLTKFREKVRIAAISNDMEAVLEAADVLRDDILPNLGVRMEDKGSGREVVTLWKLDDPELLKKEKALRQEMKKMKEIQKAEALLKKKEKDERAKIPPNLIFKDRTDIYSAFDDNGIPTKDQNGEPLPKSSIKKLLKEYQQQKKLYEDSMQRNEDSEASLHISS
jgi:cysteinyl-tRNA synthetase